MLRWLVISWEAVRVVGLLSKINWNKHKCSYYWIIIISPPKLLTTWHPGPPDVFFSDTLLITKFIGVLISPPTSLSFFDTFLWGRFSLSVSPYLINDLDIFCRMTLPVWLVCPYHCQPLMFCRSFRRCTQLLHHHLLRRLRLLPCDVHNFNCTPRNVLDSICARWDPRVHDSSRATRYSDIPALPLRVALTCDPHTHMAAPGAAKASAERRFPRKQTTAEELAAKQPASRAGWRGLPGRRKRARLRGGKRRVVWSGRPRTCENKKRTMVHLFLKLWNTLCRDSGKFLKLFWRTRVPVVRNASMQASDDGTTIPLEQVDRGCPQSQENVIN
jgi:hypothetical protein